MKYAPNIEPRRLCFSLPATIPKFWHQTVIETYHFNALALFLPLLEKMVVLSLKKALKHISCKTLKSEVSSLIAQEAIHGAEFHGYHLKMVSQHYPLQTKQYQLRYFRILAAFINSFSSTFHYALSAAGEHFTTIAADLFLRSEHWFVGVMPVYSAIWRWHCIEEIEHKNVAFDVFKSMKGSYFTRIFAMLVMTFVFATIYVKPIFVMMKCDGNHKKISFYLKALQYYWGRNGLCRALFKPYFAYFKPNFHPSQQDNDFLISSWKAYFKSASAGEIMQALEKQHPPSY
ncbi:MAG: metal-dependent hydrolase [Proteobacteria bacterium]|nr:metal-dependent hydrolase [Pseudomonadota bacterium]